MPGIVFQNTGGIFPIYAILFKEGQIVFGDETCECCSCFEMHPPACPTCRQECGEVTPVWYVKPLGGNESYHITSAGYDPFWFINFSHPNAITDMTDPAHRTYDPDDPIYDHTSPYWIGGFAYSGTPCLWHGPGVGATTGFGSLGFDFVYGMNDHDPAPGESVDSLLPYLTISIVKTPGHVQALIYSSTFDIHLLGGTLTSLIRLYFSKTIDVTDPVDCMAEWTFDGNDLPATSSLHAGAESTYLPFSTGTRDVVVGGSGDGVLYLIYPECPCDNNQFSVSDVQVIEGDASSTMTVTVVRQRPNGTATVDYTTVAGSATAGTDYTTTSGTLTFNGSERSKTITIPILGDTTIETNETFQVILSNPSDNASIVDDTGIETIIDDDTPPNLIINNAGAVEGDVGGTQQVIFTVTRSSGYKTTTVHYSSANGTATAGVDYTAVSGTLTFGPGVTSQIISVPIIGDVTPESDETFTVTLDSPTFGNIVTATGTATITNDDYCWYKWRQTFNCVAGTWSSVTQYDVQSGATNPYSGPGSTWYIVSSSDTECVYEYYYGVLRTSSCGATWPSAPDAQTDLPTDTCGCAVQYCWYRFEQNYQCSPPGWYSVSQESVIVSASNPFPESEGSWQQYYNDSGGCGYHYVVRGTEISNCDGNWPSSPTPLSGTPGGCCES